MKAKLQGSAVPVRSRAAHRRRRPANIPPSQTAPSEYRVGPGRPPREYQFKPGQSGNPKGAKRKTSLAPDLRALLERALNEKVKLKRGEQEKIVSKAAAGIQKLVNGFAEGDRHARRDLILLADRLGFDLTAGQGKNLDNAIAEVVSAQDEALLAEYVEYHVRERLGSGTDGVLRLPKPASSDERPIGPEEGEK
jgi:hypothetical protein